ncbi:MAG: hypothetical protein AAFV25_03490 [Bacteroidota bacterium]
MDNKLRIALVIQGETVPAWAAHLLQRMGEEGLAEIGLILRDAPVDPLTELGVNSLLKWHLQLDRNRFGRSPDAFAPSPLPAAYQTVDVQALEDYQGSPDEQLDALLWLSNRRPPAALCAHFPQGVWSYLHGEEELAHKELLGYWEFVELQEVIVSGLKIQWKPSEEGRILYRSWSVMPSLSITRALDAHFWKIQSFVLRALRLLGTEGPAALQKALAAAPLPKNGTAPALRLPSVWQTGKHLTIHALRLANKLWKKSNFNEQWLLLCHWTDGPSYEFGQFQKLLPPRDRFWADPFLWQREGRTYLFLEELPFQTEKGHLSVMEIFPDQPPGPVEVILDKDYHLSYPFLFEYEGDLYMIPESYQANNIQLYLCTDFPTQWEFKMCLMDNLCAMDTTLFFHNDKWWLFTAITETEGSSHHDELFLFYADTPLTDQWTPHPMNPIVSDVRSARPAGNLYWENGQLIRPSQDCSRKYGYGFNLNVVEELSETTYRERVLRRVRPDWDASIRRTHSFNHLPGITVIDGLIQRWKH